MDRQADGVFGYLLAPGREHSKRRRHLLAAVARFPAGVTTLQMTMCSVGRGRGGPPSCGSLGRIRQGALGGGHVR
jgi:hypothetical protein